MGLDINVFENVRVHSCDTRAQIQLLDGKYFKRKMGNDSMWHFLTRDTIEDSYLHTFTPVVELYNCDCEADNVARFGMGYSSCFDIEKYPYFGPYEFEKCENIYFGSYIRYFRLVQSGKVPILQFTSDSDGCYGGDSFLIKLKNQLEAVKETDEAAESYFNILDGKDLSSCVVQHC